MAMELSNMLFCTGVTLNVLAASELWGWSAENLGLFSLPPTSYFLSLIVPSIGLNTELVLYEIFVPGLSKDEISLFAD